MRPETNLVVGWLWILLGFVSGMVLGMFFHQDTWLGGYGSLKRRMYRLGHISFFGLGAVNLLFGLTIQRPGAVGPAAVWSSAAFMIGAVTMPACCVLMAHFPKARFLFAVPVLSLLLGGTLTCSQLVQNQPTILNGLPGLEAGATNRPVSLQTERRSVLKIGAGGFFQFETYWVASVRRSYPLNHHDLTEPL